MTAGMINVTDRRCAGFKEDGTACGGLKPAFDEAGGKGTYCVTHKAAGMENVKSRRCKGVDEGGSPSCRTQPVFGLPSGKPTHCSKHKLPGMANLVSSRCEGVNDDGSPCQTITPKFDFKGGRGCRCSKHQLPGMEDIRSKRCEGFEKDGARCTSLNPVHDFEGGCGRFCASHMAEGMFDVRNPRCEGFDDSGIRCRVRATFGYERNCPRFCAAHKYEHKEDGMRNVIDRRCLVCDTTVARRGLDGHCYRCFVHTFPDNKIVRNHKTKERCVADHIRSAYPTCDVLLDGVVPGGCSRRRPDVLMDMGDRVVIVEVDETQHSGYDVTCENRRMMELFVDCGSRPLIMVRMNPDGYVSGGTSGSPVKSCWGYTKTRGLCAVLHSQKEAWESRLRVLKEAVDVAMACDVGSLKEVNVVHLF
jgi:hypothetical protein